MLLVVPLLAILVGCGYPIDTGPMLRWENPTTYKDGSPLGEDLAGINLYCGRSPGTYEVAVDAGLTEQYPLRWVAYWGGETWCAAKAYTITGVESDEFSNEAYYPNI